MATASRSKIPLCLPAGTCLAIWVAVVEADIDYNNFWAGGTFGTYNGTAYATYDAWKAATGQQAHGLNIADPLFVDPANGDFHLRSDSPMRNAGVVIPGLNSLDGPYPYTDNAPSIGAYEYSAVNELVLTRKVIRGA